MTTNHAIYVVEGELVEKQSKYFKGNSNIGCNLT
jgi:hypothetical protein